MRILSLFSLVSLALFSMACNQQTKQPKIALTEDNSIVIEHQVEKVRVPLSPERVVVFDYGALDTFGELGLTQTIVGAPKHSVPSYLKEYKEDNSIENVGGLMEPNFQKINELEPDLIIIGMRQVPDYKEFAAIAPTIIYELDYKDFMGSVDKNVERIGKIFQIEEEVQQRLSQLHETLELQKTTLHDVMHNENIQGLIVMFNDGKFSAYGKGSRFGIIHDFFEIPAVAKDLEVSTHGNSISSEFIQEHNPDVLFVLDRNAAISDDQINTKDIENNLVKQTDAYKNQRITYLSPDVWYLSGGGIQSLEIMAKEVGDSL